MEKQNIVVVAIVKVKPGNEAAFKAATQAFMGPSRNEEANINYQFTQSVSDPLEFGSISSWKSQAALEAHQASSHAGVYFSKIDPMFQEGYPQIHVFTEFGEK